MSVHAEDRARELLEAQAAMALAQLELRTTLAEAHREIARLRNSLHAIRDQARAIGSAERYHAWRTGAKVVGPAAVRADLVVGLATLALRDGS